MYSFFLSFFLFLRSGYGSVKTELQFYFTEFRQRRVMLNYAGEAPEAGDGYTPRRATDGRRPRRRRYAMTEQLL